MAPEIFEVSDQEPPAPPADEEDLTALSVKELRQRLRRRGLSDIGLVEKAELVARLREADPESSDDAA